VTERRKERRKQLLDELKGTRECCKLKEEALDRTVANLFLEELRTCRKAGNGMNGGNG
jgi:hypothetical protein